jgi:hypothetical protein
MFFDERFSQEAVTRVAAIEKEAAAIRRMREQTDAGTNGVTPNAVERLGLIHIPVTVHGYDPAATTLAEVTVNAAMTMTVVRCPYCISDNQFRQMATLSDGRFVCDKCGHLENPGGKNIECPCRKCFEMREFDRRCG